MKELAKQIDRDKSTLTVLVKKLIKNGYVKSIANEEDKRSKIISLTDKGRKIEEVFYKVSMKLNKDLWIGITNKESDVFNIVINKMINNLKKGRHVK